jgi:hypothetical protein
MSDLQTAVVFQKPEKREPNHPVPARFPRIDAEAQICQIPQITGFHPVPGSPNNHNACLMLFWPDLFYWPDLIGDMALAREYSHAHSSSPHSLHLTAPDVFIPACVRFHSIDSSPQRRNRAN